MKNLIEGAKEFSRVEYRNKKELFKKLKDSQSPHTLFIACSDSRVIPDLITKSLPGELFVIRNIANIVPYFRQADEYLSTTSAIEYAVLILNVKNIVICGHSGCGGCKALVQESVPDKIAHVSKWMQLAEKAKKRYEKALKEKKVKETEGYLEKENVIEQINHLLTYPFIKKRYEKEEINIYGWYYDIARGSVYNYDMGKKKFFKIN
ncbi:MAG: carbonic anhydrase [Elusimicrobiota bacterium]